MYTQIILACYTVIGIQYSLGYDPLGWNTHMLYPYPTSEMYDVIKNLVNDIELRRQEIYVADLPIYNSLTGETIYRGSIEDSVLSNWLNGIQANVRWYSTEELQKCYADLASLKKTLIGLSNVSKPN